MFFLSSLQKKWIRSNSSDTSVGVLVVRQSFIREIIFIGGDFVFYTMKLNTEPHSRFGYMCVLSAV